MLFLTFKNECTFFVNFLFKFHATEICYFQEKIECLQTLGAEVYPCPVKPWTDPDNYNHQVRTDSINSKNVVKLEIKQI